MSLVPFGDGAVQRSPLCPQHQLVGHVAGDDVLEHPRQLRLGRLEQDEAASLQPLELAGQARTIGGDRMDVVQQAVGEAAPDDVRHFERRCCGAANRSMRVRTTPCTVSGSDSACRSAPGAIRQVPLVTVMTPVSRSV